MKQITNHFSFLFSPSFTLLTEDPKQIAYEIFRKEWEFMRRICDNKKHHRPYHVRKIYPVCRLAWLCFREYDVDPQDLNIRRFYGSRSIAIISIAGKRNRGSTRSNSVTRYALSNRESFLSIYSRWISDDFIKLVYRAALL